MPNMSPIRTTVLAGAALAAALLASGCEPGGAPGGPEDNAVKVVKDFLIDGAVDHNGYEACVFMTARQQRVAARRVGAPQCRQAFDLARLELRGKSIDTVHEIEGLTARSKVRGSRAWVRLSRGRDSVEFRLVKANAHEENQFLAPDTNWRIARGALPLIPPERA
jgi:hypothetical protein